MRFRLRTLLIVFAAIGLTIVVATCIAFACGFDPAISVEHEDGTIEVYHVAKGWPVRDLWKRKRQPATPNE